MKKENKVNTNVALDKHDKKEFYKKYPSYKKDRDNCPSVNIRRLMKEDLNFAPVIVNPEQLLLKAIAKGDFGDPFSSDGNSDKIELHYQFKSKEEETEIQLIFKVDFDAEMEEKRIYELDHWFINTNLFKYHILDYNIDEPGIKRMIDVLIKNIVDNANYYIQ